MHPELAVVGTLGVLNCILGSKEHGGRGDLDTEGRGDLDGGGEAGVDTRCPRHADCSWVYFSTRKIAAKIGERRGGGESKDSKHNPAHLAR